MALHPRTPVIIGVGQVVQRSEGVEDAREPLELMVEAVEVAARDAGLASVPKPDSIRVVNTLSWRYRDPGRLIAESLGLEPRETVYTTASGNSPQLLVNATAQEIQAGQLDLALLTGGEAWRTRMRARRNDAHLAWRKLPEGVEPSRTLGDPAAMNHPSEVERGLVMPVQMYPMFESAIRAAAREGVDEHLVKISELWADFSSVAATNPYAWNREKLTAEEIRTPSPTNRMIGLPYPKYMNSNNDVDQSAAVIMCSAETASSLGVRADRWVFPIAGVDCHDHHWVSNRADLASSPAVQVGGRTLLGLAETSIDRIDLVDLYSCFPSAVQAGAAALGLSLDRQLSRTGGLSFAGGPWNNYVMHAIATMVTELRERPESTGLVWGNGGFLTKHSLGLYAASPGAGGFLHDGPQAEIDALPMVQLVPPAQAAGHGVIEAYTVMHNREGEPEEGFAAVSIGEGRRAWGTSVDSDVVRALGDGEWVGRRVDLDQEGHLQLSG